MEKEQGIVNSESMTSWDKMAAEIRRQNEIEREKRSQALMNRGEVNADMKAIQDAEIAEAIEKEVQVSMAREVQAMMQEEALSAQTIEAAKAELIKTNQKLAELEEKSIKTETESTEDDIESAKAELLKIKQQLAARDKEKTEESTKIKLKETEEAKTEEKEETKPVKSAKTQPEEPENPFDTPLVAINADWTHDSKEIAHDLAEQALNDEVAKGNIAKRIWKGTLFKKFYEEKYAKEFLSGERQDEKGRTIKDIIKEQKSSVIERFTMGVIENDRRFVHEAAGEKLEKANPELTASIRSAIEEYAKATPEPGQNLKDLDREFQNKVGRIMQEAIDGGLIEKGNKTTNYLSVAKEAARRYQELATNARGKAEHEMAMEQVMAGFRVYNAEVRNGVRTEAHRDNIDKITNWWESSKIGQFIPSEIVAGAAGAALALTQTGTRAIFGAAGGIIASSALSGLKERNRITEDRTRMLRDVANGLSYDGKGLNKEQIKEIKGRNARKMAKYEANIGGTLYDMQKATDLASRIESVMEDTEGGENHTKELLSAIAEARVRTNFSDSEQKDLISYSSADKRGDERLRLDIALIKAEKSLSEQDKIIVRAMKQEILDKITEGYDDESGEHHAGVDENDEQFKKLRAKLALKKAGKTLALGSAFFLGSQEIASIISPNKIGIFERAGLIKTTNSSEASETLLAKGFDFVNRGKENPADVITRYETTSIRTDNPDVINRYEADGYTKTEVSSAWSEPHREIADIDPANSTAKIDVKYDGWAINGSRAADGNELRTGIENGRFFSTMRGTSTVNGQTVNYDPTNTKGFLTIGNSKFEIVSSIDQNGQLSWGENGVFTTTTGETIKAIGDNGEKLYRYFEVALDNGVDPDGVQHIIPLATDVGSNSFSGTMQQIIETAVEHPAVYEFTKQIPITETIIRDVDFNGFAFAPELGRTGLGEVRASEAPERQPETA